MEYDLLFDKLYDAYYDCRSKKRGKKSALRFEMDCTRNLRQLARELCDGTYEIGKSTVFAVTRPKLREVFAADFRDRIIHHLIILEFGRIIDKDMIDDSFSCRVGKGVEYGVRRLREQIIEMSDNYTVPCYTLSCDISGFFMSIDKSICYDRIETLLREKCSDNPDLDWWLDLIRKVVMNRPELNCEIHGEKSLLDKLPANKTLFKTNGKGFPIGNLTSQIFGNFYLTGFDKWSIAFLGDRGRYCRYVDDVRATSRDKKLLMCYMKNARIYLLKNLGLKLHPTKWSLQEVHNGIPFIGSVVRPWGIYAGNRLVNNAFNAAKTANEDTERYVRRLNSYFGFLVHSLTYGIRYRLWKAVPDDMRRLIFCVDGRKVKVRRGRTPKLAIPEDERKNFM